MHSTAPVPTRSTARRTKAPAAFYVSVTITEDRNPFTRLEWRGAAILYFEPALILPNGRRTMQLAVKATRDPRKVLRRLEAARGGRVRLEVALPRQAVS